MDPTTRLLQMGAAGVDAPSSDKYIEDVFSTWLYTGNGSTQTITNGIDLSRKGGLVWLKSRSTGSSDHYFSDTSRGASRSIFSNSSSGQLNVGAVTSFGTLGFTLSDGTDYNGSGTSFTSWTFREQAKFFDIVTWTGSGANRTISHSLGSVPGCIIVKRTDTTGDWQVYHRSLANTEYMVLNSTAAKATGTTRWNSTTPTSTEFSLGTDATVNASGGTYVAYLFAHDAGGFGDSGNDSVVSCGSYTNNSSQAVEVNLGWEPQLVLVKSASGGGDWIVADTMRGIAVTQSDTGGGTGPSLSANSTNAENATGSAVKPTSTGFKIQYNVSASQNSAATTGTVTYIYIAIRRGPMKTPTDATTVFKADETAGSTRFSTGFSAVDLSIQKRQDLAGTQWYWASRLTGTTNALSSDSTAAEAAASTGAWEFDLSGQYEQNYVINPIMYLFRRAPGFFDVVAYRGFGSNTGATANISHSLGVSAGLVIVKARSDVSSAGGAGGWHVLHTELNKEFLYLNSTSAGTTPYFVTGSTSSVFTVRDHPNTGYTGFSYISYLFASCPGVSKVGSYTGTGTTLSIDCGFTAGARFVLIKRTDSTGDWYVWDSARGIIAGNDPYLLLNSTAAEVTNTDYIDTYSAGFEISSTAPAAINASGGSFIFLAIA